MNGIKMIWPAVKRGIAVFLLLCVTVSLFSVYATDTPPETSGSADTAQETSAPESGNTPSPDSTESSVPQQQEDPAPSEPQEIDLNKVLKSDIIYFWHKGMPPTKVDGMHYPVLLVWGGFFNNTYYLKTGNDLIKSINDGQTIAYKKGTPGSYSNVQGGKWPFGYWAKNRSYKLGQNMTSTLNFNFGSLLEYGDAVSFELPDVPFMMAVDFHPGDNYFTDDSYKNENYDRYTKGKINRGMWIGDTKTGFFVIGLDNAYTAVQSNRWLYGRYIFNSYIQTHWLFGYDETCYNAYDWYLDTYEAPESTWVANADIKRTISLDNGGGDTRSRNVSLERRVWYAVYNEKTNSISLQTFCDTVDAVNRESGSFTRKDLIHKMRSYNTGIQLWGNDSKLVSVGDHGNQESLTLFTYDTMRVYYAEPSMVNYLVQDIVIEDGMVANLDGPVVINPGVTITVENGGVLSINGWVINNGKINIESGGTMIIQKETLLQTMVDDGAAGGCVNCQGNIVILSTGKMHCGGTYGLSVGDASSSDPYSGKIVNYGTIMAENYFCYKPYSIENRGSESSVFIGYGIEGSGYSMIRAHITGTSYYGMGNTQSFMHGQRIPNDIFGEGASRVYTSLNIAMTGDVIYGGGIQDPNKPVYG